MVMVFKFPGGLVHGWGYRDYQAISVQKARSCTDYRCSYQAAQSSGTNFKLFISFDMRYE